MTTSAKSATNPPATNSEVSEVNGSTARFLLLAVPAITVALLWSYWTNLTEMAQKWSHDPLYSHGYLVPVFAVALLWLRRGLLDSSKLSPSWWGLPVLLAGVTLQLVGAHYYLEWFEFLSLVPVVAGLWLLLGGWQAVRWGWPSVAFLVFMVPLPFSLEVALQGPLRRIGTLASTYLMQTLGLAAVAEGNIIIVNDARPIGVEEACSGLGMLMIFFALSAAVALLCERALWERLLILLSAVPIALAANIFRITVTGLCYALGYDEFADRFFHDFAGWLMMPLGLLLLWSELWILSRLFVVEIDRPMSVGLRPARSEPRSGQPLVAASAQK